jgi:GNAT superfamily N-acetyltransferase
MQTDQPAKAGGFILREAQRQDIPAIVALWEEMMDFHHAHDPRFRFAPNAARELQRQINAAIRSRSAHVLVAESAGYVIGYILGELHVRKPIYPMGRYGFISDISVTQRWRRRGVGRALVESLLLWFRRCEVTAIELFISEANPISVKFWEAMGFRPFLRMLRLDVEEENG